MPSGAITYYDNEKGFGFIRADFDEDLFFHLTSYRGDLSCLVKDARVEFEIENGNDKRRKAVRIRVPGGQGTGDLSNLYVTAHHKLKCGKMLSQPEIEELLFYLPIPDNR